MNLTDIVMLEAFAYAVKAVAVLVPKLAFGKKYSECHNNLGFPARYMNRRMLLPFPFDMLHIFYDCLRVEYLAKKQGIDARMCDPTTDKMFMDRLKKFY